MTIKRPWIYAHRGGAGLYSENTLPAFASCIQLGVDVLDMDICMSYDKEIIVSHSPYLDPDLTRDTHGIYVSKGKLLIKDLTVEELKRYHIGIMKPGTLQEERPRPLYPVDSLIPTLYEVIAMAKTLSGNTMRYQIEIKYEKNHSHAFHSPDLLIPRLLACLYKQQVAHLTEIQCFDWDVLTELQRLDQTISTAFLSPSPCYHFTDSLPKTIHHLGGTIWGPEYSALSKELMEEARHLKLKVIPWTVNTEEAMDLLIQYEVDGIITDRPDILRKRLSHYGKTLPLTYS